MKALSIRIIQVALLIMCNLYGCFAQAQYRTNPVIDSIGQSFVRQLQINKQDETLTYNLIAKSSEIFQDRTFALDSEERFYIYNLENMRSSDKATGFFIVSTDQSQPAIIGYSENSNFDNNNIPPAFKYWLSTFCYKGNSNKQQKPKQITENKTNEVKPLLGEIQWGQGTPFSNSCPTNGFKHCLTGCVATAMAQVMKYYEYPDCGFGKVKYVTNTDKITIEKNLADFPFSWENIIQNYGGDYTEEQANAVATLMSCCGASVKMDYGVESSGAYQYDLLYAYLNYFGYDKDAAFLMRDYCSQKDWHTLLMQELDAGHPVNYAGQSKKDGGHSFVVDGYRNTESTIYPYYHINWGWEGQCDGYYQIAELRPNIDGEYSTEDGFNDTQQMIIGIKPEDNISEDRNVICTSELKLDNKEFYSGEDAKVEIAEIYNFSLDTFDGNLFVVLVDSNKVETRIGKLSPTIQFMNSTSDQNIYIEIPDTIASGNYTLELRSIRNGSNNESKVYSVSYPNIRVIHAVNPTFASKLGAVELETTKNSSDDKQICINAYIITNRSEEPFNGLLQMTITDLEYNPITQFGSQEILGDLDYLDFLSDPISFYGYIPEEISNGEYFLCLASKHTNEMKWNLISHLDDSVEQNDERILSLPMSVVDDIITVGKQTYRKGDKTSINKIPYFFNINIVDDGIIVSPTDKAQFITIHDYLGRNVLKRSFSPNEQTRIRLPKGYYVMSVDGKHIKFVL